MERSKKIVKISLLGILVNFLLAGFKAGVGILANSIAVILDAVNNLSDALSSVITIVGMKLSAKRPDKKHPFGHGRIEYFSAVLVALIVLVAGVGAFQEAVQKIINPEETEYSILTLVIIIVAVFVKFFFGRFVRRKGKELNSGSLVASGTDAISDAALSFSVFVGALVSYIWGINLEGYLGILIAIMIIRTAIEILREAIDDMVGIRADAGGVKKIKGTISEFREVEGVYDLAIHNYGPNKMIASAHIQVDDEMRAQEIHRLTRRIEFRIFEKYGIIMTIGIYAANEDGEFKEIRESVEQILSEYENVIQMHGFYVDDEYKIISFDLIFDFEEKEPEKKVLEIKKKLKKKYPKFETSIILDTDISE